jgi:hypothetical protein
MKKPGLFSACLFCAATALTIVVTVVSDVTAAGAAVVVAGTGTTAAASPPPEPTELNWSRRPVLFSHQTHLNAPALRNRAGAAQLPPERPDGGKGENSPPVADTDVCTLCHHPVNGIRQHLTCATQDCHDNLNPKDKSVRSYYLATHAAPKGLFYSCVACHEEQAEDDAPTMKRMIGCENSACHH